MNKDFLILDTGARQLNIELSETQLAQFEIYKNELLEWNAKTNLISENSSQEIISRHFLDSLTALEFIPKPGAHIIDVGCGAGFPGIPLKIARPSLEIYLLEANRKKVSFLKHILRLLNFSTMVVIHDRVENIISKKLWKGKFDILISRAAFKLSELQSLGDFFLTPEGELIAMKGSRIEDELQQCLQVNNRDKFSQWIQYDVDASFLAKPRKIIIGKK